jgi:hypothetical protein
VIKDIKLAKNDGEPQSEQLIGKRSLFFQYEIRDIFVTRQEYVGEGLRGRYRHVVFLSSVVYCLYSIKHILLILLEAGGCTTTSTLFLLIYNPDPLGPTGARPSGLPHRKPLFSTVPDQSISGGLFD